MRFQRFRARFGTLLPARCWWGHPVRQNVQVHVALEHVQVRTGGNAMPAAPPAGISATPAVVVELQFGSTLLQR